MFPLFVPNLELDLRRHPHRAFADRLYLGCVPGEFPPDLAALGHSVIVFNVFDFAPPEPPPEILRKYFRDGAGG